MNGPTWADGGAGIEWAGICIIILAALYLTGRALIRWIAARLESVADNGDGQGGIPGLGRAMGEAARRTEQLPIGDLVIHPEQEKHAAWRASRLRETSADLVTVTRQRCHRCRTGSVAFRCTCETDCYEVDCHGWAARNG